MIDTRLTPTLVTAARPATHPPVANKAPSPVSSEPNDGYAGSAVTGQPDPATPTPRASEAEPTATVQAPSGPVPVDRKVPMLLEPVAHSLGRHWDFLYSRVDPARPTPDPNKVWCDRQRAATATGVARALAQLQAQGHQQGTGKVAVLGGGYEVDLKPLLEQFAEVHVVDLTDKPFPVVERQNADDPNLSKLRFVQTDLSGVDPLVQGFEIERLRGQRDQGRELDLEGIKSYMGGLGEMSPSALESGAYKMVVAPVLTESMPYGPLLTDVEARRDQSIAAAGVDDSQDRRSTWKHVSSYLPDSFYFDPQVRQGFDRLFLHQSQELHRLLEPGGVGVTSFWTRPDERQAEHAPGEENLSRLGDNTVTAATVEAFFSPFQHEQVGEAKIYGPENKPTVRVYTLAKPT